MKICICCLKEVKEVDNNDWCDECSDNLDKHITEIE